MATSKDLKALLVSTYSSTKEKEWKRTGVISGGIGKVRVFENKTHNLSINTLEDSKGNISILGPVVQKVPPPCGNPTAAEIRSGRVKII